MIAALEQALAELIRDPDCLAKSIGQRGLVAVAAGSMHTLGLLTDGTVVSTGEDSDGRRQVNAWAEIRAAL